MANSICTHCCGSGPVHALTTAPTPPPTAPCSACDMDTAFRLTSPLGRAVAGGKSQFYNTLRSDPRYQSLLMHSHAQSVRRCHSLARTYVEVVRVTDAAGGEWMGGCGWWGATGTWGACLVHAPPEQPSRWGRGSTGVVFYSVPGSQPCGVSEMDLVVAWHKAVMWSLLMSADW